MTDGKISGLKESTEAAQAEMDGHRYTTILRYYYLQTVHTLFTPAPRRGVAEAEAKVERAAAELHSLEKDSFDVLGRLHPQASIHTP